MTSPAQLPCVGKVRFRETTKEKLMEFWQDVARQTKVVINYSERVESITSVEGGFEVGTSRSSYHARTVLLAIGRRGTPRKLDVPGEESSKVVYRLIDPEQFKGRHVLVVGGGDSALEAAVSIAAIEGTTVTLSYRSGAFSRAKSKNRDKVAQAEKEGRLTVLFNSNVVTIGTDWVTLQQQGREIRLENEAVIINAGGILPTAFLKSIGIEFETKFGTA